MTQSTIIRAFSLSVLAFSSGFLDDSQAQDASLKLGISYERRGDELVIMGIANGAKATGVISVGSFISEINGRPVSSFPDDSAVNAEIARVNPVRLKGRGYSYLMENHHQIDMLIPLTPVDELDMSNRHLEWVELDFLPYPQSGDVDVSQIKSPAQAAFIGLCLEKGIQTQVVGIDRFRADPKNATRDEARRRQLKQALSYYRFAAENGHVFARNRVANFLIDRFHSTLMEAGSLDDMEEGAELLKQLVAEGDLVSQLDFIYYQGNGLSFVFAKVISKNTQAAWESASSLYKRGVAGAYGYYAGLGIEYGKGEIRDLGFEAAVNGHKRGFAHCSSVMAHYYLQETNSGIRDFEEAIRLLKLSRAQGSAWSAKTLVAVDEWMRQGGQQQSRRPQRCDSCGGGGYRGTGSSMGGWTQCYSCGGSGYR